MKKLSLFIVFIMVLAALIPVNASAAVSPPVLIYEPATIMYRPGDTVELKTTAKGTGLNFSWAVKVALPEKDYNFDFSKPAGIKGFEALDKNGKMKAKISVQNGSDGQVTSILTFENLVWYDYGVFAECTVANQAGVKTTDTAELYPAPYAPLIPEIEQISELDVRVGKLIKLACNVYPPDGSGYSTDDIYYQWYTTPDGDKYNGTPLENEDNSVLVVDTGKPGTYYYFCKMEIKGKETICLYESAVTTITVHEPLVGVSYSADSYELNIDETAVLKANAFVEPSSEKGKLSYQWMSGDNNISGTYKAIKGAVSDTYTVKGAASAGTKYYCCVVTNEIDGYKFSNDSSNIPIIAVKSTGKSAPVVFSESPVITKQPKSVKAKFGDDITLSVSAESKDGGTLKYQWYSSDTPEYPDIRAVFYENESTFSPEQTENVKYYCVGIWNTKNGVESMPVYSDIIKVELTEATGEDVSDTSGADAISDTAEISDSSDTSESTVGETDTADALSETADTTVEVKDSTAKNQSIIVIVLLAVIICLLFLVLAAACVFIIVLIKKRSGRTAANPEDKKGE